MGWFTRLGLISIGRLCLVGEVGSIMVVAGSNLFYVVFGTIPSKSDKNAEVENFRYWTVLVGRSGRSKNGHSH